MQNLPGQTSEYRLKFVLLAFLIGMSIIAEQRVATALFLGAFVVFLYGYLKSRDAD